MVILTNFPVATVSVSPPSVTLSLAATVQLAATVKAADGTPLSGRPVTWTTSAGGIATVSPSGLVTGVAVGTSTITATSEGQRGSGAITATDRPCGSVG